MPTTDSTTPERGAAVADRAPRDGDGATTDVAATHFSDLGLSDSVMQAVNDLGYTEPTPVQARAIPFVLEGRDLLAAAQTGTGKTAAFLLPCLSRLPRLPRHQGPSMLVVTPTRELAQQIQDVCSAIEVRTHHRSVTVVGGVGYNPQIDALRRGCDVLVATPGRLVDLIDQGVCDLSDVSTLVLDEADRMLDMGFLPSMRKIVAQTPADRQTLLFSATLDEKAIGGIRDLVSDPAVVEIAHRGTVAETIDQYALPVSLEVKNGLLAQVLEAEGPQRVIVFTRTKHRADACCRRLRRAGISCAPIHGNRSQNQRERALASFRDGKTDVLVATDVLARGIDVSDVRYVINFDVPADPEDYIHRIGRTGRAGETGWALTFVTVNDRDDLLGIERLMGSVVPAYEPRRPLDTGVEPPELDPNRSAEPVSSRGKKSKRGGRGRRKVDASEVVLSAAEVAALDAEQGSHRSSRDDSNNGSTADGTPRRRNSRRSTGSRGRGDDQPRKQPSRSPRQGSRGQESHNQGSRSRDAEGRGNRGAGQGRRSSGEQGRRKGSQRRRGADQQHQQQPRFGNQGGQHRRVGDRRGRSQGIH